MASHSPAIPSSTDSDELLVLLSQLLGADDGATSANLGLRAPWIHTTIPSYVFRHDRLAFWMAYPPFFGPTSGGTVPGAGLQDAWYTRMLLDPMIRTRELYRRLHKLGGQRDFVIQDFYVPLDGDDGKGDSPALSFLTSLVSNGTGPGIFPMWCCPIVGTSGSNGGGILDAHYVSGERGKEKMFINFGVYGSPAFRCPVESMKEPVVGGIREAAAGSPRGSSATNSANQADDEGEEDSETDLKLVQRWTRHLERLCHKQGGRKMLYSVSTYSKGEFWRVYDRAAYRKAKEAWDPKGVFMDVDEKVLGGF